MNHWIGKGPLVVKNSRDDEVVRPLTPNQCVPGSISGPGVICGLRLLLVLFLAPRGFSPGTPVFPSPQKPTVPNSNAIWIIVKYVIMSPWLGWLRKHSLRLTLNLHLHGAYGICINWFLPVLAQRKRSCLLPSRLHTSNRKLLFCFLLAVFVGTLWVHLFRFKLWTKVVRHCKNKRWESLRQFIIYCIFWNSQHYNTVASFSPSEICVLHNPDKYTIIRRS